MPQSQSTSHLKKIPVTAIKRESGFYKQVKEAASRSNYKLTLTRIENWVGAGIPDLLIFDQLGAFHFVELKYTTTNKVDLRPSQVAWLTRHGKGSCWVLVKKQPKPSDVAEIYLFKGSDAVDLKMDGLDKVKPEFKGKQPFQWDKIFSLICPV